MAIVAKASEIESGRIAAFQVGGTRISIANSNGTFYAFDDRCTHEECPLSEEGEVEGSELTCLCHFSVFDLDTGNVIDGPATEPLPVYPVRVVFDGLDVAV